MQNPKWLYWLLAVMTSVALLCNGFAVIFILQIATNVVTSAVVSIGLLCTVTTIVTVVWLHRVWKRVMVELRDINQLFMNTFHDLPIMMVISDVATGKLIDFNEVFTQLTGYDRSVVGVTSIHLGLWVSPADRQQVVDQLAAGKRRVAIEADWRTKDGRVMRMLYYGVVISVDRKDRLLSMIIDISRQKEIENQLRQTISNLELALTAAHQTSWTQTLGMGNTSPLPSVLCDLLGVPYDTTILSEIIRERVSQESLETMAKAFAQAEHFGEIDPFRIQIKDASGEWMWMEVFSRRQLNNGGGHSYTVVCQNITTGVLLGEANLLLAKTRIWQQIARAVAHDFNNQLQVLLAGLEMIISDERSSITAESHGLMNAMQQAILKLKAKVAELILLGKGKLPGSVNAVVNLADTLTKISSQVHMMAGDNIGIDCQLGSEQLWRIKAPTEVPESTITNLLMNALLAFSPSTNGRIVIGLENCEIGNDGRDGNTNTGLSSGRYVKVTVSDNGPGISPEIEKRLFEPYATDRPGGNGIGLSTVLAMMKECGGAVLYTTSKDGTTFWLYFPATDEPLTPIEQVKQAVPSNQLPIKANVRVVEDNGLFRLQLTQWLKGEPCEDLRLTGSHPTASELWEMIAEKQKSKEPLPPFEILVTDITMPAGTISGTELVHRLMGLDAYRDNLLVVLISGHIPDEIVQERADLAALLGKRMIFLEKPFSLEELLNAVRELYLANM